MARSYLVFGALVSLAACDSNVSSKSQPITPPPGVQLPIGGEPLPPGSDQPTPSEPTATGEDSTLVVPRDLTTTPQKFLQALGSKLVTRSQAFAQATENLETAGLNYCQTMTPQLQAAAADQWRQTMSLWQSFELFQVGPLAENTKSLKYSIYAWPEPVNFCKIDEAALAFAEDPAQELPPNYNRKGLQAIEYLLFEPTLNSRCAASNATGQAWNAQTEVRKRESRCAYLKPLLAELKQNARTFSDAWGSPESNPLFNPNASDPMPQLQALFENLFYADVELKNKKIAAPAGQDVKYCPQSPLPCPERKEFIFADFSRQAIDANIRSLVDLVFGPAVPARTGGFSALMRAAGRDDVADRTEDASEKLLHLTQSNPGDNLDSLIGDQNQENCEVSAISWLCSVRTQIKLLAADFKQEYTSILQLKIPEGPQGDND